MKEKPKILVVDDELPVAKSMANALTTQGYDVTIALSGEEALKIEQETTPDVVVADLMMPGIGGLDLLRTLKERRPGIFVIMVTGYPTIKSAVEAVKLGAFDYISKPFSPDEIRNLVGRAVERIKTLEQIEKGITPGASMKEPKGLYLIPNNAWAKIESDATVRIGVHHGLIEGMKKIDSIDLPKINQIRYQGEACVWIADVFHQIRRVWTPVSGKVMAVNEIVKHDFAPILNDPYGEGWLFVIKPVNVNEDIKNLKSS